MIDKLVIEFWPRLGSVTAKKLNFNPTNPLVILCFVFRFLVSSGTRIFDDIEITTRFLRHMCEENSLNKTVEEHEINKPFFELLSF